METGTRPPTVVAGAPLDPDASARLARRRQVFDAVGFTGPAAREALGTELGPSYRRVDLPLYLERLAAPTPLNTLIKVFGFYLWVDEAELRAAVAPLEPDELVALGLVERREKPERDEEVTLNFGKLEIQFTPQDASGTPGDPVTTRCDSHR